MKLEINGGWDDNQSSKNKQSKYKAIRFIRNTDYEDKARVASDKNLYGGPGP